MKLQSHSQLINSCLLTIYQFEKIDSTNEYLKKNYLSLNNYTIIKADYQTAGKGQFDRKWASIPNKNLLFSILFKDLKIEKIDYIFELILKSVKKSLEKYIENVRIKLPNDLYIGEKKISGILMESRIKEKICE